MAETVLHLRDLGLWADRRSQISGVPALFLDRDGVVVEEVNYLRRTSDVRLTPGAAATIRRMNQLGVAVVVVTNQAGVARGLFDWATFAEVQSEIDRRLADEEAHIDALFACGYHEKGQPPLDVTSHPWRKPNPGMLLAAANELSLSLPRSWLVGDRGSDLAAAKSAGLPGGTLVATGYGSDQAEDVAVMEIAGVGFTIRRAATLGSAVLPFNDGGL